MPLYIRKDEIDALAAKIQKITKPPAETHGVPLLYKGKDLSETDLA